VIAVAQATQRDAACGAGGRVQNISPAGHPKLRQLGYLEAGISLRGSYRCRPSPCVGVRQGYDRPARAHACTPQVSMSTARGAGPGRSARSRGAGTKVCETSMRFARMIAHPRDGKARQGRYAGWSQSALWSMACECLRFFDGLSLRAVMPGPQNPGEFHGVLSLMARSSDSPLWGFGGVACVLFHRPLSVFYYW